MQQHLSCRLLRSISSGLNLGYRWNLLTVRVCYVALAGWESAALLSECAPLTKTQIYLKFDFELFKKPMNQGPWPRARAP